MNDLLNKVFGKGIFRFRLNSGEEISGEVLSKHTDYFVLAVSIDFHFDGIAFIQFKSVSNVIQDDATTFYSSLFREICTNTPKVEEMPDTFGEMLTLLVESEKVYSYELSDELHLGILLDFDEKNLSIKPLSSTGEFHAKFQLGRNEVAYIKSGTEYIKAFEYFVDKSRTGQ